MTHVQRDETGHINGPKVSLPEHPDRTFVGEVHELMKQVDLLVANYGGSPKLDEDARQIIDAALGVGFDYGVAYAQNRKGDS